MRGTCLGSVRGGLMAAVVFAMAASSAHAKPRLLRRINGHAWVRSTQSLAGVELGYLAHLHDEVERLAPGYLERPDLLRPEYIIDVAPAGSRRSAGTVMAVGGWIVLHTTLGPVRRFERSGLVRGLCQVWAVANRIAEDCRGFAPYFDLQSPVLFERPAPRGAYLDVTVTGEETTPLACLLTINAEQMIFTASDGLPVSDLDIPVGRNHFLVRCHREIAGAVEVTVYEGVVEARPARRVQVWLDWEGLVARPLME